MPLGVVIPVIDPSEMELNLDVHIPDDFLSLKGFDSALQAAMRDMANEARDFWVTQAGQRLKSTRSEYQQAVSVDTVGDTGFSLKLSGGFLPYALELGMPAYDMNVKRGQIVPLNVDRQVVFSNPKVYRTGTGEPWKHPGFEGLHLADAVAEELTNVIIPKYIQKVIEEL